MRTELSTDYAASINFINPVIEDKMQEADSEFIKPIITKMHTWLPILSVSLWEADDAKDKERKVNAAIRIALKPQEMIDANEQVEMELEKEDEHGTSTRLTDMMRNIAKDMAKKEVTSQLRKNYSGGTKNQDLKPTKNGRELKNASKAGKQTDANSNTKSKDKKGKTPKQSKKSKQGKTNADPEGSQRAPKTNRSRNRGNRGGSNTGGKGNNAGRR